LIQALANSIAGFVVKNDDTADFEIMAYGYGLIVSAIVTYTAIIISALFFGVFREMLVAIATYITMRATIGGVHANSRAACFITYAGALYLSIYLSFVLTFSEIATAALYLFNMALLILYAPSDTAEQPIVRRRPARKILGIVFLSLFFSISIFWDRMWIETNILLLVSTITCVFLHPAIYRLFGCKKSIY